MKLARSWAGALLRVESNTCKTLYFGFAQIKASIARFSVGMKFVRKRTDSSLAEHSFGFFYHNVVLFFLCMYVYSNHNSKRNKTRWKELALFCNNKGVFCVVASTVFLFFDGVLDHPNFHFFYSNIKTGLLSQTLKIFYFLFDFTLFRAISFPTVIFQTELTRERSQTRLKSEE